MKRTLVAIVASLGALAALPAAAQSQFAKPEDAVKYRKAAFTVMAAHFGRVGAMVAGRVPFDAAAASSNADIAATMSKLPFAGFVADTASTDKGGASAKIWAEHAKFDEGAKKLQDDMAKLAAAAKTATNADGIKAAFGEAAKNCKGCHDTYRNP